MGTRARDGEAAASVPASEVPEHHRVENPSATAPRYDHRAEHATSRCR